MATPASDWLRHFWLFLWNRWKEFNETWQEARSQIPLPSLCFSGRSEKQDGHPGLWFAETFLTSPLKPLNGIKWNLTGSKISTLSTKYVFVGPIGKTRWPPWSLIGWDIFGFSSETAEQNSLRNVSTSSTITKFVFFRSIGKTRWPPWPIRQKGGTLYSGARYVALWASCFMLSVLWWTRITPLSLCLITCVCHRRWSQRSRVRPINTLQTTIWPAGCWTRRLQQLRNALNLLRSVEKFKWKNIENDSSVIILQSGVLLHFQHSQELYLVLQCKIPAPVLKRHADWISSWTIGVPVHAILTLFTSKEVIDTLWKLWHLNACVR